MMFLLNKSSMKRFTKIILPFFITLWGWTLSAEQEWTVLDRGHYLDRQRLFHLSEAVTGAVVFLGDSLMERCDWCRLFERRDILNRGIDGDTTAGVLNRLPHIMALRPASLFLYIGINDLQMGVSEETASNRYLSIVRILREKLPGTRLHIMGLSPSGKASLNEKIRRYNTMLRDGAASAEVPFIDLYGPLSDHAGVLQKKYAIDGIHLTGAGYAVWKRELSAYLER